MNGGPRALCKFNGGGAGEWLSVGSIIMARISFICGCLLGTGYTHAGYWQMIAKNFEWKSCFTLMITNLFLIMKKFFYKRLK